MRKLQVVLALVIWVSGISFAGSIVGKVKAKGVKHSGDAVVFIEKVSSKTFTPPKEHPKFDQKNLMFHPHVLPVLAGTTVDFLNSDDVLHNVFSPEQCADKFNLGTWPKGQIRSYTFKTPGCAPVMLCNVHPEMEAYVIVLETPYYAVSEKDGSYRIKDIPAGKYTLKIWHEKLKGQSVTVEVPESGDVTVDFDIHR
ncbi:MAG: carboxypeptidase regulatory-like domain-containing protein [Bacteroidota bacterium]